MFNRSGSQGNDDDDRKDLFGPVADLMVGVVFIFIILMIALSLYLKPEDVTHLLNRISELETKVKELERSNAQLVQQNEELTEFARFVRDSRVKELLEKFSRADETRMHLLGDLQRRLAAQDIHVIVDPDNGTLKLPSGRLFAIGRADPTPEGRDTLLRLGAVLAQTLPCYVGKPDVVAAANCPQVPGYSALSAVYVEGHTDVVPYANPAGRYRDNWDLSAGRAIEAFRLLRDSFEVLRELRNTRGEILLGVSGYAETRPADAQVPDRHDNGVRDQDRRIEVRITMSADERAVGAVLEELNQRLERIDGLVR